MSRAGSAARTFGAFWWDFIVGDDWRIAAAVIAALAVTAALGAAGVSAWWVVPAVAAGIFVLSLRHATRPPRPDAPPTS